MNGSLASRPSHVPFDSIYRENYEAVTERRGRVTLFPHTEQLPHLLRALNLEFYGKLPDRIARVDHRADGFHKNLLRLATSLFCQTINSSRADGLRLFDLPDANLVHRVSIVQQITEETRHGLIHRFRFYAAKDFFPEIRLSGRRLVFADHVLQRNSDRLPNKTGEDLSNLLTVFYGGPCVSLPCGPGRAFFTYAWNGLVAFPYREQKPGEYFIATCLTANEINSIELEVPPCAHNFHYDESYSEPAGRHWFPIRRMLEVHKSWVSKKQPEREPEVKRLKWDSTITHYLRDIAIVGGYGPGSQIVFQDRIPGPHTRTLLPGEKESLIDELEHCRKLKYVCDWPKAFAERDATLRGPFAAAPKTKPPA